MKFKEEPVISNVRGVCVTEKTAILIVNYKSETTTFSDLYRTLNYLFIYQSENIQKVHIYVDFRPIENGVSFYTFPGYDFDRVHNFLSTIFITCRSFAQHKKTKFYIHFNKVQMSYFGSETDKVFKDMLLADIQQREKIYSVFNIFMILSNEIQYYRVGNGEFIQYVCIGVPAFKNKERIVKFQKIKKSCLSTGGYHQYTFNYKEPFYHLNFDDSGIEMYREGKLF